MTSVALMRKYSRSIMVIIIEEKINGNSMESVHYGSGVI